MVKKYKAPVKKSKAVVSRDKVLTAASTTKLANDELAPHQPYDKFVKCAFNNKAIAIDFFAAHLKDTGLSMDELKTFKLSNKDHDRPFEHKLANDVVYHGEVGNQSYYLVVEHQSSFDKKIVARLLQYTVAIMNEYTGQKSEGIPVILGVCLYHNTRSNSTPGCEYKTTLASCYIDGKEGRHASCSRLKYEIQLVDLTAPEMDYATIASHGHAAILELFLKDAPLSGDTFIAQAKQHLASDCYKNMTDGAFDEFKLSLYEYILFLGDGPAEKLIEALAKVVPEEKGIMITAAEQLWNGGLQQGLQQGGHDKAFEIAKKLFSRGEDFHYVKEVTELPDEELAELSPDRKKSISPSRTLEANPRADQLAQSITGTAEQTAIGELNIKTAADPETGVVSHVHKRLKDS